MGVAHLLRDYACENECMNEGRAPAAEALPVPWRSQASKEGPVARHRDCYGRDGQYVTGAMRGCQRSPRGSGKTVPTRDLVGICTEQPASQNGNLVGKAWAPPRAHVNPEVNEITRNAGTEWWTEEEA